MFFLLQKALLFFNFVLFFLVFIKKIEELKLVYFIQIGLTVTSKSLLKVKTRRRTNTFWAHCMYSYTTYRISYIIPSFPFRLGSELSMLI